MAESPEERDRRIEDDREPRARDPRAVAEQILETPLDVKLTPRQIGKLLGLAAMKRYETEDLEERRFYDDLEDQLARAVAQIGARP